jgi:hypothetical protein
VNKFDPFDVRETYLIDGKPPFLKPSDVSEWLGVDGATLADWRESGEGPSYHQFEDSIRYDVPDVEAWLRQKRDEQP